MRTRSGPGCLWHTSPTGNRTHNLGVLSIGFKLLPVLASIGSGISAWFILWFRDQLSVHHLQWNQGLSEFLSPTGFEPWHPLISTVNDLKAEGPLSESLRGVQLEVGQSAVVKPPFEREYEAQQSSHHSLFLSPNSRVTVMSYQDRQSYQDRHELPRPTRATKTDKSYTI